MMPICKPTVNKSLDEMNAVQRAAESFRYVILNMEFWISPEGNVRGWIKSNARIVVCIAAPTFTVFPVITVTLRELSSCANALTAIAGKLVVLSILVLIGIVVFFRIISASRR